MPKTKTSSGKGLHFRVGEWHDKDVLRDAINKTSDPSTRPEPLHLEETLHILPRHGPSTPTAPAPAPARPQRGTASAWHTKVPHSNPPAIEHDTWLDTYTSSSDGEDNTGDPALTIQGPCMLICLPDGTLCGASGRCLHHRCTTIASGHAVDIDKRHVVRIVGHTVLTPIACIRDTDWTLYRLQLLLDDAWPLLEHRIITVIVQRTGADAAVLRVRCPVMMCMAIDFPSSSTRWSTRWSTGTRGT